MSPNLRDWYSRSRELSSKIYGWIRRTLEAFLSEARWWEGAVYGVVVATGVVLAILFYTRVLDPFTLGRFLVFGMQVGEAAVTGLAALAAVTLIMTLPTSFKWVVAVTAPVVWLAVGRAGPGQTGWILLALVLVPGLLVGGGLWVGRGGLRDATKTRRVLVIGTLVVGLAVAVFDVVWLANDGSEPDAYANAASEGSPLTSIDLPDPSENGEYQVLTLTYGSGEDRHRPEFGEDADYVTESVDGSKLIDGWEGRGGWARTRYWGFDSEELPLPRSCVVPRG